MTILDNIYSFVLLRQYWKRTKLHTLVEGLTADHKEIE